MKLPSFQSIGTAMRNAGDYIARKGWRESFARGEGAGGGRASNGTCPNPAKFSTWVFRCLQLTAGPVRSMPLKFYTVSKGKQVEWVDEETVRFWQRPAETASGPISFGDFMELSLHWINLKGQAFWILDDSWLMPRGAKSPILLARADRLSPIKKGDMLLGWMFTDGVGARFTLLPQQVIRPRILNPFDDAQGMAPLEAARVAVDSDYAAGVFARNVAASNGDQGVYVVSKGGGALSTEQQEQIVASLRQKADRSRQGDYRPAFLTADVSIEDPQIKKVDSAFNDGREQSRYEIFVAFGVPPSMSDKMDSYSIGAASDRMRLIEETCMPHSARLCDAIAWVERLRTGRELIVEQDYGDHPTMAQARTERTKAAVEMFKAGVPWVVLNQTFSLNLPKFAGWDSAWLPMSWEKVEESNNEPNNTNEEDQKEAGREDDQDDSKKALAAAGLAIEEIRSLIASPEILAMGKVPALKCGCTSPACSHGKADNGGEDAPDPERLKLWQKHMKARKPSEKLMQSKIRKVLMTARAEILAKLDSTEKALSGVRQRGVLDIMFDLASFQISMVEGTKVAHQEALSQALMQFAEEVGEDDPWKMESTTTLNFLSQRESKIRDASRHIYDDIKAELEAGLMAGESNAKLADRVRIAFNGISKERAEMIAATEVTAAYGLARNDAMQGLDIPEKEWLSAQDGRVRDTHMRADGQTVPMDEPFIVELKEGGTEELMFPGDATGSAENVIRCRCVQIPKMHSD